MPNFEDLNLNLEVEPETFIINDQSIFVKKYLPVEQKAAIVSLAVKGSVFEGIVNEILMDAYFHVFLVENYTNIEFSIEFGISDVLKIYDMIRVSGLLDTVISLIPFEEYNSMVDAANAFKQELNEYNRSYGAVSQTVEHVKDTLVASANAKSQPRTRNKKVNN
jgi:hypothetical protein